MTPLEAVKDLEKRDAALRGRYTPDTVSDEVERVVNAEMAKLTTSAFGDSFSVAPDTLRRDLTGKVKHAYEKQLRTDVDAFENDREGAWTGIQITKDAAAQLPNPFRVEDATPAGDTTHALRQMTLRLDRDHAERRLSGKTPAQLADIYTTADDRLDLVLKFTIEDQVRRGWTDVAIARDKDVTGGQRLKSAIASAQLARLQKAHPELLEAEARLAKLRASVVTRELFRLLKSGHGLSLVPRGA